MEKFRPSRSVAGGREDLDDIGERQRLSRHRLCQWREENEIERMHTEVVVFKEALACVPSRR